MATNTRDAVLRKLAKIDGGPVLSVYASFDPQQFATPRNRESEIRSLLDDARRAGASDADVERVRAFFDDDFSASGVAAVAVFVSTEQDLFEVVDVPAGAEPKVVVDDHPYLEPLVEGSPRRAWCVLVVNRRIGRILRGGPEGLTEEREVTDEVMSQHDQGGWSQARYQRHVEEEVADHLRHVGEVLFRSWRRLPFDSLLIGTSRELWPLIEGGLHDYLRRTVVGRIDVDVEHTNTDDVLEAARPLMHEIERNRERDFVARVSEGLGRGERAAAGTAPVLDAINERRVRVLLVDRNAHLKGVRCPQCGWLGPQGRTCPMDGAKTESTDDVIEAAVEATIAQAGEVVPLLHVDLEDKGPVAAILRY